MNQSQFTLLDLWSPNETYSNHRIPGMLVTRKGTLLVYCEARREAGDWAMMDILLQRSLDHGVTFEEKVHLASGTEAHPTVNNPVMVEDKNGRIHFLYLEDYATGTGRALHRFSDDDGVTWSEPVDFTASTMPEYRNALAFGPGHGVCTPDGTLVFPLWMVPKRFSEPISYHKPSEISTLYSKDNGLTWEIGEILPNTGEMINPNETSIGLTSDGQVYLNIRQLRTHRGKAYSKNGYSHWYQYETDLALPDPRCFGSVATFSSEKYPHVILFANCAHQTERKNVTVRASFDNGNTWVKSKVIDAERGGYVEIAADSAANKIYVLYENNKGETDHFASFPIEWLLEE